METGDRRRGGGHRAGGSMARAAGQRAGGWRRRTGRSLALPGSERWERGTGAVVSGHPVPASPWWGLGFSRLSLVAATRAIGHAVPVGKKNPGVSPPATAWAGRAAGAGLRGGAGFFKFPKVQIHPRPLAETAPGLRTFAASPARRQPSHSARSHCPRRVELGRTAGRAGLGTRDVGQGLWGSAVVAQRLMG